MTTRSSFGLESPSGRQTLRPVARPRNGLHSDDLSRKSTFPTTDRLFCAARLGGDITLCGPFQEAFWFVRPDHFLYRRRYLTRDRHMTYELWSAPSGNIVGAFSTENEALSAVREVADRNGSDYVESLALMVEDDSGQTELLAEGDDLLRMIRSSSPAAR